MPCSVVGPGGCGGAAAAERRSHSTSGSATAIQSAGWPTLVDAVQRAGGRRIGLLATFGPTLQSMAPEFPAGTLLRTACADGALGALDAGDGAAHDHLAAEAAVPLAKAGCAVIALAQFSLARARDAVADATGLPVLTTPDSAVARLKTLLGAA